MLENMSQDMNNSFWNTTLSSIGDGVIATDVSGNIIFFNTAAEEITGWCISEVKNRKFYELFVIVDVTTNQIIESSINNVLKSGKQVGLKENSVLVTKEGEHKFISANISPIKEKIGIVSGTVTIFRDITKIRNIDLKLIEEQSNFIKLFNSAPVGVIVVDENTIITRVNEAALDFFYGKKEQSIGKKFGDAFFCQENFATEQGCNFSTQCKNCDIKNATYLALESGVATTNMEFSKVFILNNKKKELWFKASITPMFDGNKKSAMILIMDITDIKVTEEGLKKYKTLYEKVRDNILFLDIEGNIIDANISALKSYGYTYDEFLKINVRDLRAEGEITTEYFHKMDTQGVFIETVHYRKDRSTFPVEISSQGAEVGGKRVIVSIIRDISERKNTEKAIKESEEKFRQLFQNSVDAIFVQEVDIDGHHGKIIEVNKTACEMFGYNYEEFLSLKETPIKSDAHGHSVGFYMRKLYNNGHVSFKAEVTTKYGSLIPVEVVSHYFRLNGRKVMFTIVRDITERQKSEKALSGSEEKFRNLFNNAIDAIFVYEVKNNLKNEKFLEVNDVACKYLGYTKEELLNMSFEDLVAEDSKDKVEEFKKVLKRERFGMFELNHKTKDNRSIPVEVNVHVFNYNGRDIAQSIVREVTQRKVTENNLKEAKEAAETANRAKSEFLANMSHEIRTPLNGIVGMVNLTMFTDLNQEQKENLNIVKSCTNSLLKVINDILDFSKMEAGKLVLEHINFDIKSLVEETIKAHSPRATEKGVELNYAFSSTIPQYLVGDPSRLQQILNNLINNAIKFTESGEVWVKVKKINTQDSDVEVRFAVEDTGIGISEENIGVIFESFSQVDGSFTRRLGGTGLGLAISKQLSEIMGGTLCVESKKSIGSKFNLTLKFDIGTKIETHPVQLTQVKKINKLCNILVTEDDKVNQMVITRILKDQGYSVDTANNGLEAVEMCEKNSYDVILMDIQMPILDGIEATKRIREKGKHKYTPIIAITAHALKGDREKFLSLGMDEYVSKPINVEDLFSAINKCVSLDKNNEDLSDINICFDESGEVVLKSKEVQYLDKMELSILDELSQAIDSLNNTINKGKFEYIEILAHKVKNLANEVGIEELKTISFKIELAARRGDFNNVVERFQKVEHIFQVFKKSVL